MGNAVIIVAGGTGIRMGTSVPKQFLEISGKPIILHTIDKFLAFDREIDIVLVINPKYQDLWDQIKLKFNLQREFKIATGGEMRFHSVKNGLALLEGDPLVGVHDAVRPLVSVKTINDIYKYASQHGNAVPAVGIRESVREIQDSGTRIVDRSKLKLIQTPQVFKYSILKKAYETEFLPEFTDDASVVEKSGVKINLVDGDIHNIKITTQEDFAVASSLLKN
jgi:2-C-methyl-D-erythritol 4-phosphate cytidylyltransferase